ncbi:MAG TPA: hypothetical protein VI933_03805 [archaeon]|nr:hypothetical protein [archaeon]
MSKSNKFSRKKGTITYLSDVMMAVLSMFSTLFMLFVSAIVIFLLHINMTGTVYGDVYYDTPAAGNEMNSILEYSHHGIPFKDILPYFVFSNSGDTDTKITSLAIEGKSYDIQKVAKEIIKDFGIGEYKATFKSEGKEIFNLRAGIRPDKQLHCVSHLVYADAKSGKFIFCSSREVR